MQWLVILRVMLFIGLAQATSQYEVTIERIKPKKSPSCMHQTTGVVMLSLNHPPGERTVRVRVEATPPTVEFWHNGLRNQVTWHGAISNEELKVDLMVKALDTCEPDANMVVSLKQVKMFGSYCNQDKLACKMNSVYEDIPFTMAPREITQVILEEFTLESEIVNVVTLTIPDNIILNRPEEIVFTMEFYPTTDGAVFNTYDDALALERADEFKIKFLYLDEASPNKKKMYIRINETLPTNYRPKALTTTTCEMCKWIELDGLPPIPKMKVQPSKGIIEILGMKTIQKEKTECFRIVLSRKPQIDFELKISSVCDFGEPSVEPWKLEFGPNNLNPKKAEICIAAKSKAQCILTFETMGDGKETFFPPLDTVLLVSEGVPRKLNYDIELVLKNGQPNGPYYFEVENPPSNGRKITITPTHPSFDFEPKEFVVSTDSARVEYTVQPNLECPTYSNYQVIINMIISNGDASRYGNLVPILVNVDLGAEQEMPEWCNDPFSCEIFDDPKTTCISLEPCLLEPDLPECNEVDWQKSNYEKIERNQKFVFTQVIAAVTCLVCTVLSRMGCCSGCYYILAGHKKHMISTDKDEFDAFRRAENMDEFVHSRKKIQKKKKVPPLPTGFNTTENYKDAEKAITVLLGQIDEYNRLLDPYERHKEWYENEKYDVAETAALDF